MTRKLFTTIIFMVILFSTGCDETQIRRADRIVDDVNDIVTTGRIVLQSPAGALLPPDLKLYGAAAIAIASIVVNSWQKVRANLMKKTTKAIVRGIESAEQDQEPNPTNKVKEAIGTEMKLAGIYDQGNQLVDQLKVAR